MKTVIVGGVAGGMSAATRLRRLDENAEIIVLERGEHVSFANCGLPYFAGGIIEDRQELILQTPESLKARFNLDVRTRHEVLSIDTGANSLQVKDLQADSILNIEYDNLILSLGAAPFIPPMDGSEHLLTLRNIYDVDVLVEKIGKAKQASGKAIVAGAGFIGLEIAENLVEQGLKVTLIELAPQVLPPLDADMSSYVANELRNHEVELVLGTSVVSATENSVTLSDGRSLEADLLFASIGVRPEVKIAKEAGIEIGERGGVVVDSSLKTSVPNIYAVGDMVEKIDTLSGEPTLVALANLANKQGRRAADAIAGIAQNEKSNKSLGTAVVKVFDLTVAMTGASSRRLNQMNREHISIHTHPNDHAGYYPGAEKMHLAIHIDPHTGEILGAQGVGPRDVVRRIDVLATAITGGLSAIDLIDLELSYAPQYGSAKDPINMLGYISDGIINGKDATVSSSDLDGKTLIDVRTKAEFQDGTIPGAINVELDALREKITEIPKTEEIVVFCQVGQRGHNAARLLSQLGYNVSNLDGGFETWRALNG